MIQEDKELLLKDLCAMAPYGVICSIYRIDDCGVGWRDEKLSGYFYDGTSYEFYFGETPISIDDISKIKPYLWPTSSITKEEYAELKQVALVDNEGVPGDIKAYIDWLNAHHFDYGNFIGKGLAIEVTKENNPYK